MLKKFIQYFRGDGIDIPSDFGGSYLDYLLEDIRPSVSQILDQCPEHDPVLLVAMELLKKTSAKPFEGDYPCPLEDNQSTAIMSDSDDVDDGDFEQTNPTIRPDKLNNSSSLHVNRISDVSLSEDELGFETTKEFVIPFSDLSEETNEAEVVLADSSHAVYTEEVLRAGRVWFKLLAENDCLPLNGQLNTSAVLLARDLWLGHALSADDVQAKGDKLLKLVEKKFSTGLFSQARILLKLFQTDHGTLINNDRNLFYEDMILRMGIRREQTLGATHREHLDNLLKTAVDDGTYTNFRGVMQYFSKNLGIRCQVQQHDENQAKQWRSVIEQSERLHVVEEFFGYWPSMRWREPEWDHDDLNLYQILQDSLTGHCLRTYIINHIKSCYFILRAVGDTGMEDYLDAFFDWAQNVFGFDATGFLPELYTRTMASNELVDTIFQDIYARYFRAKAHQELAVIFDDGLSEGLLARVFKNLSHCDFRDIAPGNYNFTGFVLDEIFQFQYPSPGFGFKLHRLT